MYNLNNLCGIGDKLSKKICSVQTVVKKIFYITLLAILVPFLVHAQVNSESDHPHIALVLEGGGALGIAHIGVIKMLEEMEIPIDIVVGTSMGSIIGGLYASGYTSGDLENLIRNTDWLNIFSSKIKPLDEPIWDRLNRSPFFASLNFESKGIKINPGLISDRKILSYLDRLTINTPTPVDFDTLPRRFRAVATDISNGEKVVLAQGSLSDAMRASMGIPGAFAPYLINGRYLVDGGLVDNLPIDVAQDLGADIVIAIHLNGGVPFSVEDINRSPISILSRTVEILLNQNIKQQIDKADLLLNIDLQGYQVGDFFKAEEILEIGKNAALAHKDDLLRLKQMFIKMGGIEKGISEKKVAMPVTGIVVEGVNEREQIRLVSMFQSIEGFIPDDNFIKTTLKEIDREGAYDSIRLSRVHRPNGQDNLLLKLEKKDSNSNQFWIGLRSSSTYSNSIYSTNIFSVGVVFTGVVTPNSKLSLIADMNAEPGLTISFLQPVVGNIYTRFAYSATSEIDTFISNDMESSSSQIIKNCSLWEWGISPSSWDYKVGFRYDDYNSVEYNYTDVIAGPRMTSVPILYSSLRILTLDSLIFPQKGFFLNSDFLYGIPDIRESREFRTLTTSCRIAASLTNSFSMEFEGVLGSDFSDHGNDTNAASLPYKPDIYNRRMFSGNMNMNERIGSHIMGLSLMGKYRFDFLDKNIDLPVYLFLHGALAEVFQNSNQTDVPLDYLYWNVDWGLGIRFNDSFGFMFRVGSSCGFDRSVKGFVALDLGSFGI